MATSAMSTQFRRMAAARCGGATAKFPPANGDNVRAGLSMRPVPFVAADRPLAQTFSTHTSHGYHYRVPVKIAAGAAKVTGHAGPAVGDHILITRNGATAMSCCGLPLQPASRYDAPIRNGA